MASNKLCATLLILSLLAYSTFTVGAWDSTPCKPPAPGKPKPRPPPPVKPKPFATPPAVEYCPRDTLKLGVCVDLLGLVNVVVGSPASSKCCAVLEGLADVEAALCLCTAIKANVLGINLHVPVTLSLLLSACQKTVPPGFQCA